MKLKSIFRKTLFLFFFSVSAISEAQTVKLTFSDLNLGFDNHYTSYIDTNLNQRFYNQAIGISGRYQTSVVANYVNKDKIKRFQIVDIVGGELAGGFFRTEDPLSKVPFWFAFRFDLGLGMMYNLTENQQISLNWFMMRFANDFISTYISGSEIQLRYRYKHISFEAGTINRGVRVGGVFENYVQNTGNQNMYSLGFRYLLNAKRNVGLRFETYNPEAQLKNDQVTTFRVFYGLYY